MEELKILTYRLDGMYQALDAWYGTLEKAEVDSEGYLAIQKQVLKLQQRVLDAQGEVLNLQRVILKELE